MYERPVTPTVRTLKAMAKAGLIKLHEDTGSKVRHWTGKTIVALYIDDVCDGVKQPFEFKGRQYRLRYCDGCFMPFVVDIAEAKARDINLEANLIA